MRRRIRVRREERRSLKQNHGEHGNPMEGEDTGSNPLIKSDGAEAAEIPGMRVRRRTVLYVPALCPECGNGGTVYKTALPWRYHRCQNPECGVEYMSFERRMRR